ncbi:MAG: hypothetical protein MHM6MM_003937 [Cercozoa sp. M6MM]
MSLKLESLLQPALLVSKKRYLGRRCRLEEAATDVRADALNVREDGLLLKGVEAVRRDGCVAAAEAQRCVAELLFETRDATLVRRFLEQQWAALEQHACVDLDRHAVPLRDLMITRQVKLGKYKNDDTAPAVAHLAKRLAAYDDTLEPQYKQRVSFLVPQSHHATLKQRIVAVDEFLGVFDSRRSSQSTLTPSRRIDAAYYCDAALNRPIGRLLTLCGIRVDEWFRAYRTVRRRRHRQQERREWHVPLWRSLGGHVRRSLRHCDRSVLLTRATVRHLLSRLSDQSDRDGDTDGSAITAGDIDTDSDLEDCTWHRLHSITDGFDRLSDRTLIALLRETVAAAQDGAAVAVSHCQLCHVPMPRVTDGETRVTDGVTDGETRVIDGVTDGVTDGAAVHLLCRECLDTCAPSLLLGATRVQRDTCRDIESLARHCLACRGRALPCQSHECLVRYDWPRLQEKRERLHVLRSVLQSHLGVRAGTHAVSPVLRAARALLLLRRQLRQARDVLTSPRTDTSTGSSRRRTQFERLHCEAIGMRIDSLLQLLPDLQRREETNDTNTDSEEKLPPELRALVMRALRRLVLLLRDLSPL